ncbi:MAG: endosialidase [Defluviitaleaceae bacterium]|nr:endosialidase [Defluviitaleaceae bacterium]
MSNLPKDIIVEADGGLSFGDYTAKEKVKVNDFEYLGNIYSLRSHDLVTRLEKNSEMLMETVPGAAVRNFALDEKTCYFEIESSVNVQVTLSLIPEAAYHLRVISDAGGEVSEEIATNRSGKLSFSVELVGGGKKVVLEKL